MSKSRNYERILIRHVDDGTFSIDSEGRIWRHYLLGQGRGNHEHIPIETKRAELPTSRGYLRVKFVLDGRKVSVLAHRLVWQFFRGDIPDDLEPNHKDGIKTNNKPDNLELTTSGGNTLHAYRVLGVTRKGEKHPKHILTESQVRWIREELARDSRHGRQAELARLFGVVSNTIRHAAIGKNWSHVV